MLWGDPPLHCAVCAFRTALTRCIASALLGKSVGPENLLKHRSFCNSVSPPRRVAWTSINRTTGAIPHLALASNGILPSTHQPIKRPLTFEAALGCGGAHGAVHCVRPSGITKGSPACARLQPHHGRTLLSLRQNVVQLRGPLDKGTKKGVHFRDLVERCIFSERE
jgi:hypothetical protein